MKTKTEGRFRWIYGDAGYILFILVISVLGYGRFLLNAPIYDFYNFFFPYRYSVVDAIHQGCLPFWNPYQAMGIPAHADPQSGVFYLPLWLFALIFGKYTTICCGMEYLFHAFVGGVGFYFLARFFVRDGFAAFVTAGFYLLSGFFVGNAQHLVWIISAAWLPWVMLSFIQLVESPGIRPMLLFPLFFSLMITGGYPGFVFVTAYLLFAIFLFSILRRWRHSCRDWKKFFLFGGASVALCALLCAPSLLSFWEIRSEITRGAALSFSQTAEPLTLRSMISLLFPYIASSEPAFIYTDQSMGNIYMGLLALPAIAVGLWKNRQPLLWLLFGTGIIAFLLAFGTNFPLNRLVFENAPLLGLIRLPGLYRIFFIIPMLLFSAKGIQYLKENWSQCRKATIGICVCLGLLFLIGTFFFYKKSPSLQSMDILNGHLFQKMMIESLVAGITFAAVAAVLFFAHGRKSLILFAAIMLSEPLLQANICGPKSIYDTRDLHAQLAKATSTEGFPIPDSLSSSEKMIQEHGLYALWTNVGMFVKEVEWYSISPIKLYRNQQMLEKYHESGMSLSLPIAFFPKVVLYDTLSHFLTADTAYTTQPDAVFACDSGMADITIQCFKPGHVVIHTQTDEFRPFALCQNIYKGWHATLDGEPVPLNTLNFTMQSVTVPPGSHEVVLEYRKPLITALFCLQAIASAAILLLLCFYRRNNFRINIVPQPAQNPAD